MKKKNKKPNLSSEAALKRALDNELSQLRVAQAYPYDDYALEIRNAQTNEILWQDSLRRLGIGKRKPLKGIMKKVRKAVR